MGNQMTAKYHIFNMVSFSTPFSQKFRILFLALTIFGDLPRERKYSRISSSFPNRSKLLPLCIHKISHHIHRFSDTQGNIAGSAKKSPDKPEPGTNTGALVAQAGCSFPFPYCASVARSKRSLQYKIITNDQWNMKTFAVK